MKYISNRIFNFLDFYISHNQLLLRGVPMTPEDFFNIDIIFFGVKYINSPTILHTIEIKEVDFEVVKNYDLNLSKQCKIYTLNKSENYFIVANSCFVYSNNLELNKTSLGVLDFEGRDNIIFRFDTM